MQDGIPRGTDRAGWILTFAAPGIYLFQDAQLAGGERPGRTVSESRKSADFGFAPITSAALPNTIYEVHRLSLVPSHTETSFR